MLPTFSKEDGCHVEIMVTHTCYDFCSYLFVNNFD